MRFHVTSYDVHAIPTENVVLADGHTYNLPTYNVHGKFGLRYNEALVYEAVQHLQTQGYEVSGESVGPNSRDENYISTFSCDGITTIGVYNCDVVVIRELDSNTFCMIDMQDYPTFGRQWSASPNCLAVYMSMYEREWVYMHTKAPEKYRPFMYFSMYPDATHRATNFLPKLPAATATDLRLFFAGTLGSDDNYSYSYTNNDGTRYPWREVAIYLHALAPDEVVVWSRNEKIPREQWWIQAAQHRWNLFLAGGPWCNREHELWSLGCATIGFTYPRHPLMVPLLPNIHYGAIVAPNGTDGVGRPINPQHAAQAILDRYRELRDDTASAVAFATQAQSRMRQDATPKNAVRQILNEVWNVDTTRAAERTI